MVQVPSSDPSAPSASTITPQPPPPDDAGGGGGGGGGGGVLLIDGPDIPSLSASTTPSSNGFVFVKNGTGVGATTHNNGYANPTAASSSSALSSSVVRVNPPGTTVYPDSSIDREEFVRLAIQLLKDIGYNESASVLEAESGYALETPRVADFRSAVVAGAWSRVSEMLPTMGVAPRDLQAARYLVSQQHYLELLEQRLTSRALNVLRGELAPNSSDSDKLHVLSSLMMCSEPTDLYERAKWDGAEGSSRRKLLSELQRYIPTDTMLPERRLKTLVDQAHLYQRSVCLYHDPRAPFSLYTDHECSRAAFPTLTTNILEHENEIWDLAWSHDGRLLAGVGKDHKATVWQIGPATNGGRDCVVIQALPHNYNVMAVAWTLDDKFLLTGAEQDLFMWNVETGERHLDMKGHRQGVSAIAVLPDGSGFVSGGMDKAIFFWDMSGNHVDEWQSKSMRVLDLAVAPDGKALVVAAAVDRDAEDGGEEGFVSTRVVDEGLAAPKRNGGSGGRGLHNGVGHHAGGHEYEVDESGLPMRRRIIVYDLQTREEVFKLPLPKEITSVCISADSRYALINHAPDDLLLLDLHKHRIARRYNGQQQREDVIRGCFGGIDEDFILSGSEDSKVYIWRKETGTLVEVLSGHGRGNVNAVAWNPKEVGMFASCSDDHTIRLWEAPPPGMEHDHAATMTGAEYDGTAVPGGAKAATRVSNGSGGKQFRAGSFGEGVAAFPRILR